MYVRNYVRTYVCTYVCMYVRTKVNTGLNALPLAENIFKNACSSQPTPRPKLVEPGGTRTGHFRNRKKKSWFMGSFALHSCVTHKLLFAGFDAIVWAFCAGDSVFQSQELGRLGGFDFAHGLLVAGP